MAAVASAAAHDLSSEFREAIPELGATAEDITFAAAREALGTAAGIYVHFTARHRAGFDLIFAAPLQGLGDESLIDAGRSVMDVLIPPSLAVTGDPLTAIRLVEQIISSAHGYATLFLSGFYARRSTNVSVFAEEASETARALALCASRTQ
ncbi:WHG domain-containing protein [Rhodococcus erythropolis]|uniref:WHG domain-containing protein n=1 Tax=Rhodococcus erythropolis TaxID=1833 RepID=UPI002227BA93|nr:WHG domain-containing protein [Rhodococcus erythropolis]MCW2295400.1 hypothetical protein [Rhodococcus erythropolis]